MVSRQRDDFLAEATALERFRHVNIVRLEAVVTRTRPHVIVTELMRHGSLDVFLRRVRGERRALRPPVLIDMLRGVASGMAYLNKLDYVHRCVRNPLNLVFQWQLIGRVTFFQILKLYVCV